MADYDYGGGAYDGSMDPYEEVRRRLQAQAAEIPAQDPTVGTDIPLPPGAFGSGPDVIPAASFPPAAAASAPSGVDRSTGGVAQTQSGYAPVSGADLQVRQAPIASTSFYNANTGAAATYDPSSGMYIDSNGQSIRPDAIRTSDPTQYAGQPAGTPMKQLGGGLLGGGGTLGAGGGTSAWQDQIRRIILSRLALDQQPVDENDPAIQAALSAARNETTRASDTERTKLAERLYAQGGLNTDAITQGVQQSTERMGGALGTLRANLIMGQYKDRLTELNHLLDLATQTGDVESARGVQMAIANLQAALQREGLGVNVAEFMASLNQNAALAGLRG